MRDPKQIQADLDQAQENLEKDLSELKHVILDKLEGPKHVIEVVEKPVWFVRDHALLLGMGAVFALGLFTGHLVFRD
ncbi:MAG TPA: hypothetical protein VGC41_21770 [Kofleriaceae bacterium]